MVMNFKDHRSDQVLLQSDVACTSGSRAPDPQQNQDLPKAHLCTHIFAKLKRSQLILGTLCSIMM